MTRLVLLGLVLSLAACSQPPADDAGKQPAPAPAAPAAAGAPPPPAAPEVVTTSTGLRYSVLKAGSGGVSPKLGDPVRVSYTGWRTDGKVFDASERRGGPADFFVGRVVPGWNEALQKMHRGDVWKLTIPPALGYGETGAGADIPPGATLVFVLELHDFWSFRKPDAAKAKSGPSGLKYEVVTEGAGEPAGPDEAVELRFALWNAEGRLLTTSDQQGGTVQGTPDKLPLRILGEAAKLIRPGGRAILEAPPELAFGAEAKGPELPANSITYWEVEVVAKAKAMPAPEFSMPPDEKLVKTASGLAYEVIREGAGVSPTPRDKVTVHYAGWLADGTPFDSSFPRGFPTSFAVGGVIRGWQEGLQLMKPGAVYKFVIPADLAYGKRPPPQTKIPPDATLVFHVELMKVGK